uniref:Uncharacterized protein n=1 Tax=Anguilla anguilla TaxID=7936 RepID=A0A0E9UGR5_ANGAN
MSNIHNNISHKSLKNHPLCPPLNFLTLCGLSGPATLYICFTGKLTKSLKSPSALHHHCTLQLSYTLKHTSDSK